jgi:hypothetical protein
LQAPCICWGQGCPLLGLAIPAGHRFDYFDTHSLLERVRVEGGDLVQFPGQRFRVLLLPPDPK